MSINIELRYFVTVAEELHFGRAAKRLHMTQPPLSQTIIALEHMLNTALFDRNRRSVALTTAGTALLPEARRLLAQAGELPGLVKRAAFGETGKLVRVRVVRRLQRATAITAHIPLCISASTNYAAGSHVRPATGRATRWPH